MSRRSWIAIVGVVIGVVIGIIAPKYIAVGAASGGGILEGHTFDATASSVEKQGGIAVCAVGPGTSTTSTCNTSNADTAKYSITLATGEYKVTATRGTKHICRANKPDGPKKRKVNIKSGETKKVNWYC